MAKKNYYDYLQGDSVKVKKYFYVLRPIFICKWFEQKNLVPPMEFRTLLELLIPDSPLKHEIENLSIQTDDNQFGSLSK